MYLGEWTKLLVCVLVVISATILAALKVISSDLVGTILAAVLGYVFGNGHGIISAQRARQAQNGGQADADHNRPAV